MRPLSLLLSNTKVLFSEAVSRRKACAFFSRAFPVFFFLSISTYTLCKLHQETSFPWQTYSCTKKEYITVFGKSFFVSVFLLVRTRGFLWQHFPQPRSQVKQVTGTWERSKVLFFSSSLMVLGRLANPPRSNVLGVYCRGGSRIFLGGGALVSCSTSTPINHIVFFSEYQLY